MINNLDRIKILYKKIVEKIAYILLVSFLFTLVSFTFSNLILEEKYKVSNTFTVKEYDDNYYPIENKNSLSLSRLFDNLFKIVKSEKTLTKVCRNLSLTHDPRQLLYKILIVENDNYDSFNVYVLNNNKDTAKKILDELTNIFINDFNENNEFDNIKITISNTGVFEEIRPRTIINTIISGFLGFLLSIVSIVFNLFFKSNILKTR